MTVFVCVDERGGMMFNKRRQSRDRKLIEDVVRHADDGIIYISDYSEPLFAESEASVIAVSNPLDSAPQDAYAFIEGIHLGDYLERIDTLVIYRWNRHYPSDSKLDIDPMSEGLRLVAASEFAGFSHEKITKEVYTRC